jgi:hypothetical protein
MAGFPAERHSSLLIIYLAGLKKPAGKGEGVYAWQSKPLQQLMWALLSFP